MQHSGGCCIYYLVLWVIINKNIMKQLFFLFFLFIFLAFPAQGQNESTGSLFIIGGGKRPPSMISEMVKTANLDRNDYIVVLPMATAYPDEAIMSIAEEIGAYSMNKIIGFNFIKGEALQPSRLDSLRKAKLIYITGGDQNRFMEVVRDTPLHESIRDAYSMGSTIAGTSAGAAVMSRIMITGDQKTVQEYGDFEKIRYDNVVTQEGLGLLENVIIDQHFIVRARYNRLLSALAEFPEHIAIGIDEGTAVVVHKNKIRVVGESQVVVLSKPENISSRENELVSFDNVNFSLLSPGDSFLLE